jgi:putative endonuclease
VHYTYVLLSARDGGFYTGSTSDLRTRVREHNAGRVRSTAHRTPLVLIYYEACMEAEDARRRERGTPEIGPTPPTRSDPWRLPN